MVSQQGKATGISICVMGAEARSMTYAAMSVMFTYSSNGLHAAAAAQHAWHAWCGGPGIGCCAYTLLFDYAALQAMPMTPLRSRQLCLQWRAPRLPAGCYKSCNGDSCVRKKLIKQEDYHPERGPMLL